MKKYFTYILKTALFCLNLLPLIAFPSDGDRMNSQTWQWAKISQGQSSKIASDEYGNSYVTGTFVNTIRFGNTTLISAGGNDIYIVKYNSAGDVAWAVKAGSVLDDVSQGIGVDLAGNVYVAGYYSQDFNNGGTASCNFSGTVVVSSGEDDIFLAKYNSAGAVQWVRHAGGGAFDECTALSVDDAGNCYLTGSFGFDYYNGFGGFAASFSGVILTCGGEEDAFVAKYDASGFLLWTEQGMGVDNARGFGIVHDQAGSAYVTGGDYGGVVFDTTYVPGSFSGDENYFIAKCDGFGWQWANTCIGTNTNQGNSICVDQSGSVYAAGIFYDEIYFGNDTLTSYNQYSSFLVKYNSAGNYQWIKQLVGNVYLATIKSAPNGNIILGGAFHDTLIFGTDTLWDSGNADLFLCNADSSGSSQWILREGYLYGDNFSDLDIDGAGNIFMTGYFTDTTQIGSFALDTLGQNSFVALYGQHIVGISSEEIKLKDIQVFPNPFTSRTTISFTTNHPGNARLKIMDTSGRTMMSGQEQFLEEGKHEFYWDARDECGNSIPSGTYFYTITSKDFSANGKFIYFK